MKSARLLLLLGQVFPDEQVDPYITKVLGIQSANLILYHPMDESSGGVATDASPEGNDGAYTGVDLADAAGPTGVGLCPWWDKDNDYNNIYSAGFAADFNGPEHTIAGWIKVNAAAVWEDAAERQIVILQSSSTLYTKIAKWTSNNTLQFMTRTLGVASGYNYAYGTPPTGWVHVALTRSESADEVKFYVDGSQVGTTKTGLEAWSGALDSSLTCVGAYNITPAKVFHGWMSHAAVWKVALTPAEILSVATA